MEYNIGVQIICPGPVMSDVFKNAFTKDINRVILFFIGEIWIRYQG